jgi:hypothetical protein
MILNKEFLFIYDWMNEVFCYCFFYSFILSCVELLLNNRKNNTKNFIYNLKKNYKHMNAISYEEFNNKAYDRRKLLFSPQLVERYLLVV